MLAARGEPVEALVEGLPVSLEEVSDPATSVSWDTFTRLMERLEGFVGGPDPFLEIMRGLQHAPVARPLIHLLGLAASPLQVYTLVVRWLGPKLYPGHTSTLERLPGGELRVVLEIEPGLRGCAAFFRSTLATFQALPRVLGLREAQVEAKISPRSAEYLIQLPPSASLVARLRRVFEVFRGSRSAIDELGEQQEELRKSYEALAASYAQLRDRERRLQAEIDERRHAEEALRESAEQLRQSQKMEAVGRLAGGIAHDFNNLMTAVIGYSDILAEYAVVGEAGESLTEIRNAAERAAALTRQLLAFSRHQVQNPQAVDLNAVVTAMERMLRRILGPDIELRSELDPAARPVRADPTQLEQVILNLVVNARDAMDESGLLQLATANLPAEEGSDEKRPMVRLVVRDSGQGMSDEVRSHVFEPFFTTKEVGQGTGLGLSTVYGIVRQSAGHISVDSRLGEGSCFVIELPAAQGEAPARSKARDVAPARGGSETVLLVEDEPAVRRLTARILRSAGYRVLEASAGDQAQEVLAAHGGPVHLLLSDVMMRGLTGPELAQRIRQERPEIRVLLMSGYAEGSTAERAFQECEASFLAKPFTTAVLLERVRSILDADQPAIGSAAGGLAGRGSR